MTARRDRLIHRPPASILRCFKVGANLYRIEREGMMLNILAKIYDDGGRILSVRHALLEGDPQFITAVELQFESMSAVFRAVPDNDTLAVSLGSLKSESDETPVEVSNSAPWSKCLGLEILRAWQLTNQQGYSDGVRLEFGEPGEKFRAIV